MKSRLESRDREKSIGSLSEVELETADLEKSISPSENDPSEVGEVCKVVS